MNNIAGNSNAIVDHLITVTYYATGWPDMNFIDLPGIVEVFVNK